jgi:hypothetical protein
LAADRAADRLVDARWSGVALKRAVGSRLIGEHGECTDNRTDTLAPVEPVMEPPLSNRRLSLLLALLAFLGLGAATRGLAYSVAPPVLAVDSPVVFFAPAGGIAAASIRAAIFRLARHESLLAAPAKLVITVVSLLLVAWLGWAAVPPVDWAWPVWLVLATCLAVLSVVAYRRNPQPPTRPV